MTLRVNSAVAILGLLVGGIAVADGGQPYTDRAQGFQVAVPEGWAASKTQGGGPVLTVRNEATPTVQLTLEIRRLAQLPELITREQLLEQARAILKAAILRRTPTVEAGAWGLVNYRSPLTGAAFRPKVSARAG